MFRNLPQTGGDFSPGRIQLFRPGIKESLVYKTTLQYKDKSFSALTYFKEEDESVFKIVMLTAFGNTLLEAEISKDKFSVNNVISYLDRKPILRLLEKDWRLLLAGNFYSGTPAVFSSAQSNEVVYDLQKKKINNLYRYNMDSSAVVSIESWKCKSKKITVTVSSARGPFPEGLVISHPSLNLQMNMTLLKKAADETPE